MELIKKRDVHLPIQEEQIEKLESALEKWRGRAWRKQAETIRLLNKIGALEDSLQEIYDEATRNKDWDIVVTAARARPALSERIS